MKDEKERCVENFILMYFPFKFVINFIKKIHFYNAKRNMLE